MESDSSDGLYVSILFSGGTLRLPLKFIKEDTALAHVIDSKRDDEPMCLPVDHIAATQHTLDLVTRLLHEGYIHAITEDQWVEIAKIANFLDIELLHQTVMQHYETWRLKELDELASYRIGVDGLKDRVDLQLARLLFGDTVKTVEDVYAHATSQQPWMVKSFGGHADVVTCLITLADGRLASGSKDGTVMLWDVEKHVCSQTLVGHTEPVTVICELHDRRIASSSEDGCIKLWNTFTQACTATLLDAPWLLCMVVLQDGRLAAGCSYVIQVWNVSTCECTEIYCGHPVRALAVLRDGRIVSGSSFPEFIKIWDPDTNECLSTIMSARDMGILNCLAVLPDGRLVSGHQDMCIRFWDPDTLDCTDKLLTAGFVTTIDVLHNGNIVSSGRSCYVEVFDAVRKKTICTRSYGVVPTEHSRAVLVVLPDGRIAHSPYSKYIYLWGVDDGAPEAVLDGSGFNGSPELLGVLHDGRAVLKYSHDADLCVVDVHTSCVTRVPFNDERTKDLRLKAATVIPDGRLACGWSNGYLTLMNVSTRVNTLIGAHGGYPVVALGILANGHLVSCTFDGYVAFWDWELPRKHLLHVQGPLGRLEAIRALPDGHFFTVTSKSIHVWHGETRLPDRDFTPTGHVVMSEDTVTMPTPSPTDTFGTYIPKIYATVKTENGSKTTMNPQTISHYAYFPNGASVFVRRRQHVYVDGTSIASFKDIERIETIDNDKLIVVGSGVHLIRQIPSPENIFLALTAANVPSTYILGLLSSRK